KNHTEYLKKFYLKPVFWSASYCILSTGGATIETIRKYIEMQGEEEEEEVFSANFDKASFHQLQEGLFSKFFELFPT
ncbi:MAG: transposase, partial [Fusobacteriaceae bacterium]